MGSYLFDQLQTLYEHPIVGDVRGGLGLLCGNRAGQGSGHERAVPCGSRLGGERSRQLFCATGLLARQRGDIIFLIPPLIVTSDEIDYVVERVDRVLSDVEREFNIVTPVSVIYSPSLASGPRTCPKSS